MATKMLDKGSGNIMLGGSGNKASILMKERKRNSMDEILSLQIPQNDHQHPTSKDMVGKYYSNKGQQKNDVLGKYAIDRSVSTIRLAKSIQSVRSQASVAIS